MYPFSQAANPALRTHIDAQTSYLNDISKSVFRSFQQMCDLNIQLMQTMLEETALASRQLLAADAQHEVLSAATSRAQPATDKLRAYQQHLSRLAADVQVELAQVTEQHAQNTARNAACARSRRPRAASPIRLSVPVTRARPNRRCGQTDVARTVRTKAQTRVARRALRKAASCGQKPEPAAAPEPTPVPPSRQLTPSQVPNAAPRRAACCALPGQTGAAAVRCDVRSRRCQSWR
jgi:phasin family protein